MKRRKRGGSKILLTISLLLIIIGVILLLVYWAKTYNPGKLVINGPFGLGTYEFNRATLSDKELDIAWKLYIQLNTRKAAIPIEENQDIISEVYDSWYQLFTVTRDYLTEMPAKDIEGNENAQQIVNLSLDVLNKGLRPHLTKWQGKYRKWYENEIQKPENKDLTPQEIQKKYPHYSEIIQDMKDVNKELIKYSNELKKFSYEKPPSFSTRMVSLLQKFEETIQ